MERDINVVAQVKEDGSVGFKTGDGLPLDMAGGKAMRNITINFSAFSPTSVKVFIPNNDPDGETGGRTVELKKVLESEAAGTVFFAGQVPIGFAPKEITINFDVDPELPQDLELTFYKNIGPDSSQTGVTVYEVTEYDNEEGLCVISLTAGLDYDLWIPSDIYIGVAPHIPG